MYPVRERDQDPEPYKSRDNLPILKKFKTSDAKRTVLNVKETGILTG